MDKISTGRFETDKILCVRKGAIPMTEPNEIQPVVESVLSKFQLIQISMTKPSPYQARKAFDEEALKGLAESMKHEGLLEPIIVRKAGDGYEVIAGERRLRAAKLLGWTTIEAKIIEPINEAATAAKGLVENIQKENLNPIEEAEGFDALNKLDPNYWTQEQIGTIAGKRQDYVSRSIALLGLPTDVLESMRQRILTREHGIELLRLNNANSIKSMANKSAKGGWSAKKTRAAIDSKLAGKAEKATAPDAGNPASAYTFKRQGGAILIKVRIPGHYGPATIVKEFETNLRSWLDQHPNPPA
jgi:ParB family transcriptional regulator, chromosome partitioning protein